MQFSMFAFGPLAILLAAGLMVSAVSLLVACTSPTPRPRPAPPSLVPHETSESRSAHIIDFQHRKSV
jgi:hypothetical protein